MSGIGRLLLGGARQRQIRQTLGDDAFDSLPQHIELLYGLRCFSYQIVNCLFAHYFETTKIYNATRINIDIGRIYQSDIVTLRVFDVLACGGFLLAERSDDLLELFEPGVEVECYATLAELEDKVVYYLEHPEQAAALAGRGREAMCARHRIRDRVSRMLAVAQEVG